MHWQKYPVSVKKHLSSQVKVQGTIGTRQEPHLPLLVTAKYLRNRQGEAREAWAASELYALLSPLSSPGTIPSVDSALEKLVFIFQTKYDLNSSGRKEQDTSEKPGWNSTRT